MKNWYIWVAAFGLVAILVVTGVTLSGRQASKSTPQAQQLQPTATLKVVATDCYEFLLPKLYAEAKQFGCNYNAYAEALKDNWVNIDVFAKTNINQFKTKFLERRIDTSMQKIVSEQSIKVDGVEGIKLIDEYKANGLRYVTILVIPPKLAGYANDNGFEIRAHYTNAEDKRIFDAMIASWQWR